MTTPLSRRTFLTVAPVGAVAACAPAQQNVLGTILTGAGGGLTSAEAAEGVRAALAQGVVTAISQVGRVDGYFRDGRIRIPLPRELADIQSQLRPLGLSGLLDELELQINRGAETAAPFARDIFFDAIRTMTIQDAIGIVNGGPTSATDYFQRRTTRSLADLFLPIIETSLQRTGAIRTFDQVVNSLRLVPLAPQFGADAKRRLILHGVDEGLDGLFYYIGQEEAAIRSNPARRTTEILQRVFGLYS